MNSIILKFWIAEQLLQVVSPAINWIEYWLGRPVRDMSFLDNFGVPHFHVCLQQTLAKTNVRSVKVSLVYWPSASKA